MTLIDTANPSAAQWLFDGGVLCLEHVLPGAVHTKLKIPP